MSKAMNRSFSNVLFGAFGQVQPTAAAGGNRNRAQRHRRRSRQHSFRRQQGRRRPGYGMAVAQAQHKSANV